MKSKILSNKQYRTDLYDLNQLIKKIFNGYRYINQNGYNIILPLTMNSVKSRPIYDNSFFIYRNNIYNFLDNSAIDGEVLNNALKDKADSVIIENDKIIFEKKEKYNIGKKLTDIEISDSFKHPGFMLYMNVNEDKYISQYKLTNKDIRSLLNYEVLLNIIGYDGRIEIELVMTKEIFPFIKKASDTYIDIYKYNANTKEKIYELIITSKYNNIWLFINTIYIYALY